MTVASSNKRKIGVKEAKEKYETHTNSIICKKAIPALVYLKNYFVSDSNQKHSTPTSDSDSTILA